VRASSRRGLLALIAVFVVTRLALAWLADHPDVYGAGGTVITGDPERYRSWSVALTQDGYDPYSEIPIEYPPGVLLYVAAPSLGEAAGLSYRSALIALMIAVDAAGLAALLRSARAEGGSRAGAWAWAVLLPLLGPLPYVRLDLVPAVATLWALERAAARAWFATGCWLGYGALVKLYPALLVPAAWLASGRRARLLGGAVLLGVIPLVPLLGSLGPLVEGVVGYHTGRGLQIESTWAALLLVASQLGYDVAVAYNFGAFHLDAALAPALDLVATVATVGAIAAGAALVRRPSKRDSPRALAGAFVVTLAVVLTVAAVFSPQFIVWLLAAVAGYAAFDPRGSRLLALLAGAAALLSQAVYPLLYTGLLQRQPLPVAVLVIRNALVGAVAIAAWRSLRRAPSPRTPRAPEEERQPRAHAPTSSP